MRAYAYGPSFAGSRRDRAADSSASVPTVVSAIEMRAIGLYAAREGQQVESTDADNAAHDR